MSTEHNPRIGDWYKSPVGDYFEIVAQDEDDDTLELQYYDGTVEELDMDTWETLQPEPIEPPEDWSGSMDISAEDFAQSIDADSTADWLVMLDRIDAREL